MNTYLVQLKPLEPYFFGGENTLPYRGIAENDSKKKQKNRYYAVSLNFPSQTTLFGTARYLCLPHKKDSFAYTAEELEANRAAAGTASFSLGSETKQDFGKLQSISPLFLVRTQQEQQEVYVPLPIDHKVFDPEKPEGQPYTPFTQYDEHATDSGTMQVPSGYSSKTAAPADAFLKLAARREDTRVLTLDSLLFSVEKVGIDKQRPENAFFKKQYKCLNSGFAFAFFLTTEAELPLGTQTVAMGQGRSAFAATITQENDTTGSAINTLLEPDIAYAFGDLYVTPAIYECCSFVCARTVEYRDFATGIEPNSGRRIAIGNKRVLLKAGSVFKVTARERFSDQLAVHAENPRAAGINTIVFGGNNA